MNQLFIELYLDEDVDVLIATLIRARGFRALTTQAAGQTGNSDEEQLVIGAERRFPDRQARKRMLRPSLVIGFSRSMEETANQRL